MKILEYADLDTSRVGVSYRKICEAIGRDDFRAAQVKKLANVSHGKFYRAKLDDADRLLFTLVRHGNEVCALMLEVIANHDYDKSRFLRGAAVDESKIADIAAEQAMLEAQPLRYLHPENTVIHLLDKPISFDDAQGAIFRQHPPLLIVGSAGSGKTVLTLESSSKLTVRSSTSPTLPFWRKMPEISITPTASSAMVRMPCFCLTVNSSSQSRYRRDGRLDGGILRDGLPASGRISRTSMLTRRSKKFAG